MAAIPVATAEATTGRTRSFFRREPILLSGESIGPARLATGPHVTWDRFADPRWGTPKVTQETKGKSDV
jgi:hypothetical protein